MIKRTERVEKSVQDEKCLKWNKEEKTELDGQFASEMRHHRGRDGRQQEIGKKKDATVDNLKGRRNYRPFEDRRGK